MIRQAGPGDMAAVFDIRRIVFIEGQNVSEAEERDGLDDSAIHLIAFAGAGQSDGQGDGQSDGQGDRPVGTARLLLGDSYAKIGRVAVLEDQRGQGLGKALMACAIDVLRDQGAREARLAAQTHALGFYENLGFAAYGETFLDAGILHQNMALTL